MEVLGATAPSYSDAIPETPPPESCKNFAKMQQHRPRTAGGRYFNPSLPPNYYNRYRIKDHFPSVVQHGLFDKDDTSCAAHNDSSESPSVQKSTQFQNASCVFGPLKNSSQPGKPAPTPRGPETVKPTFRYTTRPKPRFFAAVSRTSASNKYCCRSYGHRPSSYDARLFGETAKKMEETNDSADSKASDSGKEKHRNFNRLPGDEEFEPPWIPTRKDGIRIGAKKYVVFDPLEGDYTHYIPENELLNYFTVMSLKKPT